MRHKLLKQNILKKNKEFQQLYRQGKSYANRYMVMYILSVDQARTKIGFAAGKRLGNAVVRNRVKRLLREAYRQNQDKLKNGLHLLVVGRNPMVDVKFDVVDKAFEDVSKRAHIFRQ